MNALSFLVFFSAFAADVTVSQGAEKGRGEITVHHVTFEQWAKSVATEYSCLEKQGIILNAGALPEESEVNQLRYDLCMVTLSATTRPPMDRAVTYRFRYARIVEKLESARRPRQVKALAAEAAKLLGRAWEMDQFVNRSMNKPCNDLPEDLVVSVAGVEVIRHPIPVDHRICGV